MLTVSTAYAGVKDPVAVLFQVKGNVEYTKNGEKWKKVRRNKFLFPGYQIRSDVGGSGIITNRKTGKDSVLRPGTLLQVTNSEIKVKSGTLSESSQSNKLLSGLMKRFSRSQSYTTVRRSASQGAMVLDVARHTVLSQNYPYLVWDNVGDDLTYHLKIGEDVYTITPTTDEMIRIKISPFSGTREIKLEATRNNQVAARLNPYKRRGVLTNQTLRWLTPDESNELELIAKTIAETYPDNSFMLGSFLEKEELWVAAMDHYRQYLRDNPDEIEMTPYLFRVYKKLKLKRVYSKELAYWTQAMKE